MEIANEPIFQWLAQYAYQPEMVYTLIIVLMFASSFGLPIPEEVSLVSGGILAFMASHPERFPPPYPGAQGVDTIVLAIVCYIAVFGSDLIIYGIGKFFGPKLKQSERFKKVVSDKMLERVESWTQKYGIWAVGVFRFLPGIRFPGHMACGMLDFPIYKFVLVDGTAALISVPTQILLIAYYGETILEQLKRFKMILAAVILIAIVLFVLRRIYQWRLQVYKR